MPKASLARIEDHFADLADPRRRSVTYPLINIVTIAICAVICGADDFVAIAKFGRAQRTWLSRVLDLSRGIPSHDRFNAVLDSAVSRMRPVILAAATTILGLIPLLSDVFFVNMSVTMMAGLGFATVLTLIVVPTLYCIFFRIGTR